MTCVAGVDDALRSSLVVVCDAACRVAAGRAEHFTNDHCSKIGMQWAKPINHTAFTPNLYSPVRGVHRQSSSPSLGGKRAVTLSVPLSAATQSPARSASSAALLSSSPQHATAAVAGGAGPEADDADDVVVDVDDDDDAASVPGMHTDLRRHRKSGGDAGGRDGATPVEPHVRPPSGSGSGGTRSHSAGRPASATGRPASALSAGAATRPGSARLAAATPASRPVSTTGGSSTAGKRPASASSTSGRPASASSSGRPVSARCVCVCVCV
jgi:hypothetical protein